MGLAGGALNGPRRAPVGLLCMSSAQMPPCLEKGCRPSVGPRKAWEGTWRAGLSQDRDMRGLARLEMRLFLKPTDRDLRNLSQGFPWP